MISAELNRVGSTHLGFGVVRKPKKLWKVGDLVRAAGVTRQTIHNYCLLGLIQEVERTPGGQRLFDDSVFRRLERIARLKAKGKRLREIAELLDRERNKNERSE